MNLIDNQKEFDEVCKKLVQEPIIFVDTEFLRKDTYYAKLCIIQIATKSEFFIFDMININDYTQIKEIFASTNILKVFHAAGQDFDLFYHLFGQLPQNVFDTQIAAGVIGMECVMGYGRLCKALLHIDLDKTLQKANWLKRPLTPELLRYAIKDVEYLIPLHRIISGDITSRKLWGTYKTRSEALLSKNTYKFNPQKFVKKISISNSSKGLEDRLISLLLLREECAMRNNLPRGFCATDVDLVKLATKLPQTELALRTINLQNHELTKNSFRQKLLDLCIGLKEI